MCGIVGVIGKRPRAELESLAARMNDRLVHRGPDDAGLASGEGYAVGARRLSIIDLAGGHQPIANPQGVVIAYNGEVYNYRALRERLVRDGCAFKTSGDTEVVLESFARKGTAACADLEGMFAFAIVDPRNDGGVVHLVRDRLGKKPLYYGVFDGCLWFASEIKAILAGLARNPPLDRASIHHYLTLRYVPSPGTMWEGIQKLPPGHVLTWSMREGRARVEPYWSLHFDASRSDPSHDWLGDFEKRFLDAVEKRLLASDVPVGVLLSGGLDSSSVAAAAVELGHRDFHTFSVGFRGDGEANELPWARKVAQHVGAVHHEVEIGVREFVDFLPELVWFGDEPLEDMACVPLYFVSKLAREHVKVVLSGEGSDEILAGYETGQLAQWLQRQRRRVGWLPQPFVAAVARALPGERAAHLTDGGWRGALRSVAGSFTRCFTEAEKARLWGPGATLPSTDQLIRSWYDGLPATADPVEQMLQVWCATWLVEDLLMKADKMTMATSVELRCPFLDHTLVEWAGRLPLAWKVGDAKVGWQTKRILREFARRRLPAEILARPKQGFPDPACRWVAGELAGWARERLLGDGSRLRELFDANGAEGSEAQDVIESTLAAARGDDRAAARGGREAAGHKAWVLLCLDQWLRRFT